MGLSVSLREDRTMPNERGPDVNRAKELEGADLTCSLTVGFWGHLLLRIRAREEMCSDVPVHAFVHVCR